MVNIDKINLVYMKAMNSKSQPGDIDNDIDINIDIGMNIDKTTQWYW